MSGAVQSLQAQAVSWTLLLDMTRWLAKVGLPNGKGLKWH